MDITPFYREGLVGIDNIRQQVWVFCPLIRAYPGKMVEGTNDTISNIGQPEQFHFDQRRFTNGRSTHALDINTRGTYGRTL